MDFKTELAKAESTTKRELLTSPPPPGRCSCGCLCDHAPSSIPDMESVAGTEQSLVARSRAFKAVDLISDDEKDEKERARAQQNNNPPIIVIKDYDDEEELPSTAVLLKRTRVHSPAAATSSKRQTLLTAFNYGTNSSSSSSSLSRPAVSHQAASTSRPAGITTNPAEIATSSAIARAAPQWPTQKNIPQWLRDLKGIYNANPKQFDQHIDTRFDELETKVRLGRVDDYAMANLDVITERATKEEFVAPEIPGTPSSVLITLKGLSLLYDNDLPKKY
ncbi:hypothetical protein CEP53_010043 [Fusarium sp. AF-6]|nr:hypothetical protein CEP53_010043 [Fusarium sp. AF-6]